MTLADRRNVSRKIRFQPRTRLLHDARQAVSGAYAGYLFTGVKNMNSRNLVIFSILFAVFSSSIVLAQVETEWVKITDPREVQELVSGKAMGSKGWTEYYRGDGNMAVYAAGYDSMTIRKWKIENDGRLCMGVYSKPDKVIYCYTFSRASDGTKKYQVKWPTGRELVEFLDKPPEKLTNALNEKAGAAQ